MKYSCCIIEYSVLSLLLYFKLTTCFVVEAMPPIVSVQ